jgi:hypothetical protein
VKEVRENVDEAPTEAQTDDRAAWTDPELFVLDYEATEHSSAAIFDGVTYS